MSPAQEKGTHLALQKNTNDYNILPVTCWNNTKDCNIFPAQISQMKRIEMEFQNLLPLPFYYTFTYLF